METIFEAFEGQWRERNPPEIDRFLADLPESLSPAQRAEAFAELIAIELHYRQQMGCELARSEWLARFPKFGRQIEDAFQRSKLDDGADQTVNSDFDITQAWRQSDLHEGMEIGPYRLIAEIGQGGMGAVWSAEQVSPVHRNVALKIIRPGFGSDELLNRFAIERQSLASMSHPNIAHFYNTGVTADGQPYFVMELVSGLPLTNYCEANQLDTTGRLRLFLDVCAGVIHAHQKGIIHRDLKPSNILVSTGEEKPVPKVIDFGLAKAMEDGDRRANTQTLTVIGQVLGTLKYMSPEQTDFSSALIDTRTDVYSLGVVLYELLTGSTPLDDPSLAGLSFFEMLSAIREFEATKPSRRFQESQVRSQAGARKTIARDLDWIVMKAIEKSPDRRYASVSELAADIALFLNNQPVTARPPSLVYRSQKYIRRNRLPLAVAMVASVGLLVSGWLLWRGSIDQSRLRSQAVSQGYVEMVNRRINGKLGWTWRNRETLVELANNNRGEIELADLRTELAATYTATDMRPIDFILPDQGLYDVAFVPGQSDEFVVCDRKGEYFLPRYFHKVQLNGSDTKIETYSYAPDRWYEVTNLKQDGGRSVAVSPDKKWMALGNRTGDVMVRRYDDMSRDVVRFKVGDGPIQLLRFSDDGQWLYCWVYDHDQDHKLNKYSVHDSFALVAVAEVVDGLAWDSTRKKFRTSMGAWFDENLELVAEPLRELYDFCPSFSPCGAYFAVSVQDQICLRLPREAHPVRKLKKVKGEGFSVIDRTPKVINFDSAGCLVSAGVHRSVCIWDLYDGNLAAEFHFPSGGQYEATFSPTGNTMVVTELDGLRVFEVDSDSVSRPVCIAPMPINWALLNQDACELVTVSGIQNDRNVLIGIWSTKTKQMLRHFLFRKSEDDEMPTGAVLADEGRQLVLTTHKDLTPNPRFSSNVYVFDIRAPENGADSIQKSAPKMEKGIGDEDSIEPIATYSWPGKRHFGALPSTDPNHILFMFRQARVERLNLLSGELEMLHDRKMLELVLESSKVTASATIGKVQLLTTESGHLAWIDESQIDADMADDKAESVKIHDTGLTAVDVSPDESHVVVGTVDGQLILIDASMRKKQQVFRVSEDPVTAVCWANSDQICTGDASGKLIYWQLKSGELKRIATLLDRSEAVRKILVSNNGREIFVLMEGVYGLIRFDLAEFSAKLNEFSLAIE